jgi:hypothetical protein
VPQLKSLLTLLTLAQPGYFMAISKFQKKVNCRFPASAKKKDCPKTHF